MRITNRIYKSKFKKTRNQNSGNKNSGNLRNSRNKKIKVIGKETIYRKEKYKKGFLTSVKIKTVFPYSVIPGVPIQK